MNDAWVAKLTPNGQNFVYSTYLGAESADGAQALVVDNSGNAYVLGYTRSDQFPVLNPIQAEQGGGVCSSGGSTRRCYDNFLTRFTAAGQVAWSTYFGGGSDEWGFAIARDSSGNLYIAGETDSANYPTTGNVPQPQWAGNEDGFIAKISDGAAPPPPTATATATPPGTPPTATATISPIPNARKLYLPVIRRQ